MTEERGGTARSRPPASVASVLRLPSGSQFTNSITRYAQGARVQDAIVTRTRIWPL